MITVNFDLGNGMTHHMGGDYDTVEDAVAFATKMVGVIPRYKGATVKKDGKVIEEVAE